MTEEERKVLEDRLSEIRQTMMFYSNTGHPDYLALAKEEKELMDKLYRGKNMTSIFKRKDNRSSRSR